MSSKLCYSDSIIYALDCYRDEKGFYHIMYWDFNKAISLNMAGFISPEFIHSVDRNYFYHESLCIRHTLPRQKYESLICILHQTILGCSFKIGDILVSVKLLKNVNISSIHVNRMMLELERLLAIISFLKLLRTSWS